MTLRSLAASRLNLDYVGLNYPFWAEYPAVLTAADTATAGALLDRIFSEAGELERLAAQQRESGKALANLDGGAGERFMDVLTTLAAAKTASFSGPKSPAITPGQT